MKRLTQDELKNRLRLDYRVCTSMFGGVFSGEAYRTSVDMQQGRNPIASQSDGYLAKKYRVDFYVKTLIGPGSFSNLTTITFDLDVANYPYQEPTTQIISGHVPYSPHFKQGSPVCIGEIWERAQGQLLLGQLFVHIARLLNWDEIARGGGYAGWNAAAIEYHRHVYGSNPITPGLSYPVLPPDIYGISSSSSSTTQPLFRPIRRDDPPPDNSLFRGKGRG